MIENAYLQVKKASRGYKPAWREMVESLSTGMMGTSPSELRYMLAGGMHHNKGGIRKSEVLQHTIGFFLILTGLCFTFLGAYIYLFP
ncbi:MAG: hypothetical protein B6U72_03935 [Candidatus Altiarchaeales archaeon ex4484_2]|nr:MAG: hypothetical protein B6U72_03935 [Candidatus Altiarchaeales archaeon ex4484_2]